MGQGQALQEKLHRSTKLTKLDSDLQTIKTKIAMLEVYVRGYVSSDNIFIFKNVLQPSEKNNTDEEDCQWSFTLR